MSIEDILEFSQEQGDKAQERYQTTEGGSFRNGIALGKVRAYMSIAERIMGKSDPLKERLREQDEMTLTEYTHEGTVTVKFFYDIEGDVSPGELEEALAQQFEGELHSVPVAADVEVVERGESDEWDSKE